VTTKKDQNDQNGQNRRGGRPMTALEFTPVGLGAVLTAAVVVVVLAFLLLWRSER
jgi:hypothetical protein